MALSSSKVKYMVANSACCETLQLHKLIAKLINQMLEATVLYCDNQSFTKLPENQEFHDHSKHIDSWYNFIRETVQKGAVILEYVPSYLQVGSNLTKPLAKGKFEMWRERLGLVENTFLAKRKCQSLPGCLVSILLQLCETSIHNRSLMVQHSDGTVLVCYGRCVAVIQRVRE